MFDISWTELLLVAVVAIIVVGPKELPGMLRSIGRAIGTVRRMAGEFQSTFNDAVKEAEKQAGIDEMRKQADAAQNFNPLGDLKQSLQEEQKQLAAEFAKEEAALSKGLNGAEAEKADEPAKPAPQEPTPVEVEAPKAEPAKAEAEPAEVSKDNAKG